MKKGEVYFADLDPTIGSEVKKVRPVLIVSNNINNKHHSLVTVLPITSQIEKIYPFEVFLKSSEVGLQKDSKIQCNQIRTISKLRIRSKQTVGKVSDALMNKVEQAILLHLGISQ